MHPSVHLSESVPKLERDLERELKRELERKLKREHERKLNRELERKLKRCHALWGLYVLEHALV